MDKHIYTIMVAVGAAIAIAAGIAFVGLLTYELLRPYLP